ncbi:MAG: TIGR04282 family arsenosugar biosynthesis glycosyltransferase [Herpetosiphonaceae bacterium]|nr:TIGR04282 family arsenosugar biosynthesis glycosyltransferase [Herpetosiphonaceae bacterium]
MKRCLIIVAKEPVAGQVKTRMAGTLGADRAADLYRCTLQDTIDIVASYPAAEHVISYAPASMAAEAFFAALAPGFTLIPQHGNGFGERLFSAFTQLAAQGADRMVMIGTDNPSVPQAALEQAFVALDRTEVDAVLGAVSDGGYYLIGMRRPQPILFERITWSTEIVAAQTRERAKEAGLALVDVLPWYDLDTVADLQVLLDDVARSGDGRAPRTYAFVQGLGEADLDR